MFESPSDVRILNSFALYGQNKIWLEQNFVLHIFLNFKDALLGIIYTNTRTPILSEKLATTTEPENPHDKYAVYFTSV